MSKLLYKISYNDFRIITVLRDLIISGALSQLLSYVRLWQFVKFFSYFSAPFRTTLYRLYKLYRVQSFVYRVQGVLITISSFIDSVSFVSLSVQLDVSNYLLLRLLYRTLMMLVS